jgi:hypothetical protein
MGLWAEIATVLLITAISVSRVSLHRSNPQVEAEIQEALEYFRSMRSK